MSIAFRNTNEIWAFVLTETLKRLGLNCVVICPGSRSTPLAVAFAQQKPTIEVISILDERSAAFFALGRAKVTGKPVAVVCTSGTAGANFYPAVIEAKESCIPLLLLTADRPQELRECHSGQTIDQVKLYGNYPNWHTELALPSVELGMLAYLRQTLIHAWRRSLAPVAGVVHLNIPLRDPLAPIADGVDLSHVESQLATADFFSHIIPPASYGIQTSIKIGTEIDGESLFSSISCRRGILIAGIAQPQQPQEYCAAISQLSKFFNFPVLAEGLSPVRNYADFNPYLISTYDSILRNSQLAAELAPEVVILIGEMPTSKELRTWLQKHQPLMWIIDKSDRNLDSLHLKTEHLRVSIDELAHGLTHQFTEKPKSKYLEAWCQAETITSKNRDRILAATNDFFEGKVAWLLSQTLPAKTPLFIANSMPVRDMEFFWKPNNLGIQPFCNRGANGIDGTLSTAFGVAHRHQPSVLLTGDLTLLHDTNGFLIRNKFVGHLTIILINNNGGGIFEMLPIAQFEPPFTELFATPQDIDFAQLCTTYGVEHHLITSWQDLQAKLNPLPTQGIRVLELRSDRKADAQWRKENLANIAL
ncbi:2-succinyl-5-enolpyruvyl-6-hydroxy-3-cyclohexene-1-carboxylic-acid synthase [Calothrix sp. UHCC 0171]|uniref:2-succinyl-5-enolpyruvyl-6-hydroxy-3- cyclohexene-1-carboxylic-acid synthase n=1 Tax=Calothrix sp. UHCC 0171 TaxID=3110245 RepID=UPI002B1FFF3B|nr:2-succinyl-5-enolpyruvyl-6-hydroxy-3-cyclohexene-1-carboxylic-acid synthase [Calothrix sp. UHCC 0171]MEA5573724.1 2-succinyl-5-enolpyruvyl-6-hydroxy-3-cyclohexene-1-carboxylic-acid synthase [Calothrix sp. UHCC 0171]